MFQNLGVATTISDKCMQSRGIVMGHTRLLPVLTIPYIERIDKKITPWIAAVKEIPRETAARLSLLMGYVDEAPAR